MSLEPLRVAIGRALGLNIGVSQMGNITDYFVTAFDSGDFLSTHGDGASGSAAWVLHLARGWDKARGGELRFNSMAGSVVDLAPAYNRMSLFLTRPGYVPHQVLPVRASPPRRLEDKAAERGTPHDEPRFGFTGWYMAPGDHLSAYDQMQNALMKDSSSKGSMCV